MQKKCKQLTLFFLTYLTHLFGGNLFWNHSFSEVFDFYELLVECDRKSNPYHHPRGDRDKRLCLIRMVPKGYLLIFIIFIQEK